MTTPLVALEDALVHTRSPHDVLARLNECNNAGALLDALGTNDRLIAWSAARSYRHPNGFDRIVLMGGTSARITVRLHIWWPDEPANTEQIHNHAWDFSSLLLMGALRFQTYADGDAHAKFRYSTLPPAGGGTGYRLQPLGETTVSCTFDSRLPAGTIYTLDHTALHRVASLGAQPTATLIVHGPFIRQHSEILADQPLAEVSQVQVRHFTAPELRHKLDRLRDALTR